MIDIFLHMLLRSQEGLGSFLKVIVIGLIPLAAIVGLVLLANNLYALLFLAVGAVAAMAVLYFLDRKYVNDHRKQR